jgi:Tfp pilus assembly protein PilO
MRKPRDPKAIVFCVVATLLVVGVGWFKLVAPRRHESSSLARQIEDVRIQITTRRLALRPTRRQALEAADFFPLARAMPTSPDMPDLLLQLSGIAADTGIRFDSITPGSPVSAGSYTKLPLELGLQGRFYDLADFLYRVRNLVDVHGGELFVDGRLISVDGISFGQGEAKFPQVNATLTIDAYQFNSADPPLATTEPLPAGASATGVVNGG